MICGVSAAIMDGRGLGNDVLAQQQPLLGASVLLLPDVLNDQRKFSHRLGGSLCRCRKVMDAIAGADFAGPCWMTVPVIASAGQAKPAAILRCNQDAARPRFCLGGAKRRVGRGRALSIIN